MKTAMLIEILSNFFVGISICIPRISLAFLFSGFFSKTAFTGMVRTSIIFSIASFAYPMTIGQVPSEISVFMWVSVLLKEAFLGCILGILVSMGIWVYEIIGTIIDNQRGGSFSSAVNPFANTESSVLGLFMLNLIITIFFIHGFFLKFLRVLYFSFLSWPIFDFFPQLNPQFAAECLNILGYIFSMGITFAAPVILMMSISEAGLAFVNIFAPQLQVFFLAMPIKSFVAFFVLSLYFWVLIDSTPVILGSYEGYLAKIHYYFSRGQ